MPKYFDPVNHPKKNVHNVTIYGSVITLSGSSGTANITINGVINTSIATYAGGSLTTTATNWVAANYDYYYARGFIVTSSANVITVNPRHSWDSVNRVNASISAAVSGNLTGTVAGRLEVDFSKGSVWRVTFGQNMTILYPRNAKDGQRIRLELIATGNYTLTYPARSWYFAGGTEHVQTTAASIDILEGVFREGAAARVDILTLSGSSGTANITAGGVTALATFNGSLGQTATDFVTANAAAYLAVGITLTANSTTLIFTAATDAAKLYAQPKIVNVTTDLDGLNVNYPAGRVEVTVVTKDIKQ